MIALLTYFAIEYRYEVVLGILPTGWAQGSNYNRRNTERSNTTGDIHTFLVPYSEHSNYAELYECVRFLHPNKVIPTVFSDAKHAQRIQKRFHNLLNHTNNKRQFIHLFSKRTATASAPASTTKQKLKPTSSESPTMSIDPKPKKAKISELPSEKTQWTCGTCTLVNTSVRSCAACGTTQGIDQRLTSQMISLSEQKPQAKQTRSTGAQRTILSFFPSTKGSR